MLKIYDWIFGSVHIGPLEIKDWTWEEEFFWYANKYMETAIETVSDISIQEMINA